jgi:hypothetical protein
MGEGIEKEMHRPGMKVAGEDKLYRRFFEKTGLRFPRPGNA